MFAGCIYTHEQIEQFSAGFAHETPMNYRSQQRHEQTWRFDFVEPFEVHPYLLTGKYNLLICNNITNICTDETLMHYRTQQGHE